MDSDEEFARKLQEEFDNEAKNVELQSRDDALLAQKLASAGHNISDSESDEASEVNPSVEDTCSEIPSSPSFINVKEATQTQGNKRPLCEYGSKCYRKNTTHLLEFYHPGRSELSDEDETGQNSKKQKADSSSQSYSRMPFEKRLEHSNPFRFFLNKIYSIPETQKDWQTLVFPDLLNPKLGSITESVQFNFMVDLDFVMKFYESCGCAKAPVLFMYGQMEGNPKNYERVICKKVDMPFQYGVHHTKMMLFLYKEGMRVVIHTANLIPDDWNEKTQGYWVSPLFPPLPDDKRSLLEGESKTGFKRDLVDYLLSYKSSDLVRWTHIAKGHDFSSCCVYFIGCVPGYHTRENRIKFGHTKCRQLIRRESKWKPRTSYPVIVQCSSIGSLGKDSKSWLTGEFGSSFCGGSETTDSSVKVIYPSEDDVRNSCQGYGGGSCLPYNSNTHEKQPWLLQHLHCWRSGGRLRTGSMPHIKTYTRVSSDLKEAQFFLLTSSNLSKAAWGQLQKQGTQLFIRSYEVGVLWLPESLVSRDSFRLSTDDEGDLKLPYDLPLTTYPPSAVPWFMNTKKSTPDIHGNAYP